MPYSSIILELMTRIQKLEDEVSLLQEEISSLKPLSIEADANPDSEMILTPPKEIKERNPYGKTTDEMIDLCYVLGKKLHSNASLNIWDLADQVVTQTGMNRNSAFMYIYVIRNMLDGTVYKRIINANATRRYFSRIYAEFGVIGLSNALQATKLHIAYLNSKGISSASIQKIYDEFMTKL